MICFEKSANFCQHLQHRLSFSASVCPVGHRKKILFFTLFANNKKWNILFDLIELFRSFIVNTLSICQVVACRCALSGTEMKKKKKILMTFFSKFWKKSNYFVFFYFIEEIILLNFTFDVIFFLYKVKK